MKTKIYLRIGKEERKIKCSASTQPDYEPLYIGSGYHKRVIPTVSFALNLNIPDEKFEEAEKLAGDLNIALSKIKINTEVAELKDD